MSTVLVLMALILLSWLGSVFASGRGVRGLPSGSEFLILGAVAGPLVTGFVPRGSLVAFDPVAYVGVGWLALSTGLEYGHVGARRVGLGRMLSGIALAIACSAVVGAGVFFALPLLVKLPATDRLLLAAGVGCVCAETTRQAVGWVVARRRAAGPLTDLLTDLAHSDEIVPIALVAVVFAVRAPAHGTLHLPPFGWAAATIGVGAVLGVVAALLLARDRRVAESWGTILGASLLTIGLAARLDLAALTATFALGATIAWSSRHRAEIRAMIAQTDQAVTFPMLVLAGARLDGSIGRLGWIVPLAIALRFLAKLAFAPVLRAHPAARRAGPLLGLGLVSSGAMSVAIGLAFALRFPGPVGDTVLASAVAATIAGEVVGPAALRRILGRACELGPEPAKAATPDALPAAVLDGEATS